MAQGLVNAAGGLSAAVKGQLKPENIKEGVHLQGGGLDVTGTFTEDATASANQILAGQTAYVRGKQVVGTMPTVAPTVQDAITAPSVSVTAYSDNVRSIFLKLPLANAYFAGVNWIKYPAENLVAGNIRSGVNIFGVTGNYVGKSIYMQGFGTSGTVTLPAGNYVFCGMSSSFSGYDTCPSVELYVGGSRRCGVSSERKYGEWNGSGYSVKSDIIQVTLTSASSCYIRITDINPRDFKEWGVAALFPA